jgi:hypothetical protein
MGYPISAGRKTVKPPAGCEGHLSRREAAIQLGLCSEFKIRQFERDGRLHAVRGRMSTAFYPEAEVLALRAEMADQPRSAPGRWTDADLIALLRHPTASGRPRTAVDLVTEAKVNIARAERVYRFWCKRDETLAARVARAVRLVRTSPDPQGNRSAGEHLPAAQATNGSSTTAPAVDNTSETERRSAARLTHDHLIRSLRDPDPRVRAEAFVKLKESPRP